MNDRAGTVGVLTGTVNLEGLNDSVHQQGFRGAVDVGSAEVAFEEKPATGSDHPGSGQSEFLRLGGDAPAFSIVLTCGGVDLQMPERHRTSLIAFIRSFWSGGDKFSVNPGSFPSRAIVVTIKNPFSHN